MYKASSQMLQH